MLSGGFIKLKMNASIIYLLPIPIILGLYIYAWVKNIKFNVLEIVAICAAALLYAIFSYPGIYHRLAFSIWTMGLILIVVGTVKAINKFK